MIKNSNSINLRMYLDNFCDNFKKILVNLTLPELIDILTVKI